MQIDVKLYGEMKKYAPGDQTNFTLSLDPGATLENALSILKIPEGIHVALINGRRVAKNSILKNGSILVLFPVVSGG